MENDQLKVTHMNPQKTMYDVHIQFVTLSVTRFFTWLEAKVD